MLGYEKLHISWSVAKMKPVLYYIGLLVGLLEQHVIVRVFLICQMEAAVYCNEFLYGFGLGLSQSKE